MDCIPSVMEAFPAIDEEQFEFIKSVIDDCDYYILIIAGKYGSLTPEGISYTEKEYDYAHSKSIPVLSFIHKNPSNLASKNTESVPQLREKLDAFRAKVQQNRLVKFWEDEKELPSLVSVSLARQMKIKPGLGWVRGSGHDKIIEYLTKINSLNEQLATSKSENQDLKNQLSTSCVRPNLDKFIAMNIEYAYTVRGKEEAMVVKGANVLKFLCTTMHVALLFLDMKWKIEEYLADNIRKLGADEGEEVTIDEVYAFDVLHACVECGVLERKGSAFSLSTAAKNFFLFQDESR